MAKLAISARRAAAPQGTIAAKIAINVLTRYTFQDISLQRRQRRGLLPLIFRSMLAAQIVDNVAGNGGSLQSWSIEVCMNQQLLPVELVSFNAVKQQNAVALNWETATERNNKGFYVERSTGSDFDFQRVGFVPAVTNIQPKNHYLFTDPTVVPGNIYYYRLRQEDTDGHFVYSDVKSIAFEGAAGLLQIAPNPARTAISLTIDAGEKEATYSINVFSNDGRLVLSRLMPITEPIDISTWPDGVYTVQALTERKVWIGKVVNS